MEKSWNPDLRALPSFIIHSNPIWLGALFWVSHCPSFILGSLRLRGGKVHLGDGEWQAMRDNESILALEITPITHCLRF